MRPLRKGKARTDLATGLALLAQRPIDKSAKELIEKLEQAGDSANVTEPDIEPLASTIAQLQAAVLGGAIEEALKEMKTMSVDRMNEKDFISSFWRLANENLWRLTRALEASHLLDKAGE